jgi:hypothetical protein
VLRPIEAPVAQHSMPEGQSATGSSHCQSVSPVAHAVPVGWHAAVPVLGSQQCCDCGLQYSLAPPSVLLNGQ